MFGVNKTAVITLLFLHDSPHTAVDHSNTACVLATILAVLSEPACYFSTCFHIYTCLLPCVGGRGHCYSCVYGGGGVFK